MSAGSKFHSCGEETEKPLFRSFLPISRDQELNLGRRPTTVIWLHVTIALVGPWEFGAFFFLNFW